MINAIGITVIVILLMVRGCLRDIRLGLNVFIFPIIYAYFIGTTFINVGSGLNINYTFLALGGVIGILIGAFRGSKYTLKIKSDGVFYKKGLFDLGVIVFFIIFKIGTEVAFKYFLSSDIMYLTLMFLGMSVLSVFTSKIVVYIRYINITGSVFNG